MALSPVLRRLQQLRVVLASASPRRQEILSNTGLRFEVVPSKFKETLSKVSFPTPYAYAVETAKQKALEVARRMYQKDLRTPDIVIGADTIVAVEDSILEKPVDKQDAYRMLSRLSGKEHSVFTGVAILRCCSSGGELQMDISEFYEETKVTFSELSEELLWEYIHSGEPMDKAGGYGIQALGGMLVEQVHGDFLNVVGFPLNRFCKVMATLYPVCPASAQLDSIPAVDTFDGLNDQEGFEPKTSMDGSLGEPRFGEPMPRSDSGPKHAQDLHGADGDMQLATLDSLLRLIDGFKASKALFTACKLHVFDVLRDGVPHTPAEVAAKVDASLCGTRRLLDACTGLGLLHRSEQGYMNSEVASTYLVSEGEDSLLGHVLHSDDCAWAAFTHLESAMLRVEPRGHPIQAPHAHGLEQLLCLRAWHELTKLTAHSVVTAFDLSRFHTACHVGGCTGALAWELAREFPHMRVTVVDVPPVIEHARYFQPPWGDTERVSFVPGDVFRDILPEAELYILSPLHQDWPQDKVHQLLQRVSDACEPGRGLLLAATAPVEELGSPHSLRQTLDLLLRVEESQPGVGRCQLLDLGFRDVQLVSCEDSVDVTLCSGRKVTQP